MRDKWLAENGKIRRLPPKGTASHLIAWLVEIGFYRSGMNGPTPLTFTEIQAWSSGRQLTLRSDEPVLLRSLSCEFCSQFNDSGEINTPAPYQGEYTEEELVEAQKEMRKARRSRNEKTL